MRSRLRRMPTGWAIRCVIWVFCSVKDTERLGF
jgi:hypothetical protein